MLKNGLLKMVEVFSSIVLQHAQQAQEQGYVLSIGLSDGLVKARVKGEPSQIYNVHIDLKNWPSIPARCNCQSKKNCEHAAAALYELQARESYPKALTLTKHLQPQNLQSSLETSLNTDEVNWYSEIHEEELHFFSYELGILIDNQSVNLVPLVLDFINRFGNEDWENLADNLILKLPITERKVLKIQLGRLKPLLRLIFQFNKENKDKSSKPQLNHYQLFLLEDAEGAITKSERNWTRLSTLKSKLQTLKEQTIANIKPPKHLNTTLRDYQQEGVNWLQFLRVHQFGGVLADDMGLGKTVQALAHLQFEKEHKRLKKASLILAPTSLVGNWYEEVKRFTPTLKTLVYHGLERHKDSFDKFDLVISTYGVLQRDRAKFLEYLFYYVILDEAQFIKNAKTKTRQMVQQLRGQHRLCLTGTPLENHLGELWSLFHFLMPGLLGSYKQFSNYFKIPIEKENDEEKLRLLIGRINPFILRRSKDEVAKELPYKTEIKQMLQLRGTQRDLYESLRVAMETKVREAIEKKGLGKSHIVLLEALLRLRQVCCDPSLLPMKEAEVAHGNSVKLKTLIELLQNLIKENRRVLVFSQFTSMLKIIENKLIQEEYPYLKLTGQTKNRQRLVNKFQDGDVPIFLISLKAGGTGLNLTGADTVIHYDPWWNPAVEEQATDRTHRIGQKKPVFVYKLITEGTVEEVIANLQEKKRKLFTGVLSNQLANKNKLSEEDIEVFFKPLE